MLSIEMSANLATETHERSNLAARANVYGFESSRVFSRLFLFLAMNRVFRTSPNAKAALHVRSTGDVRIRNTVLTPPVPSLNSAKLNVSEPNRSSSVRVVHTLLDLGLGILPPSRKIST